MAISVTIRMLVSVSTKQRIAVPVIENKGYDVISPPVAYHIIRLIKNGPRTIRAASLRKSETMPTLNISQILT